MGVPSSTGSSWAHSRDSSIALAMASGQEVTVILLFSLRARHVARQRIPFNCSTSTAGSTPDRSAADTARQVASDWDWHPPFFPTTANTSQAPCSSTFTVVKMVPQPILSLYVRPSVTRTRGRGIRVLWFVVTAGGVLPAVESVCP